MSGASKRALIASLRETIERLSAKPVRTAADDDMIARSKGRIARELLGLDESTNILVGLDKFAQSVMSQNFERPEEGPDAEKIKFYRRGFRDCALKFQRKFKEIMES